MPPAPVTAHELRDYVHVLVCRTVGGCAEYDAFTASEEARGCAATCQLLRNTRAVEAALQRPQQLLVCLQQAGHARVVGLCDAVRKLDTVPDDRVLFWGLCSLTGIPTHNSLRVKAPTAPLLVDARFACFVQSYWLLEHMQVLEAARIQTYLAQAPGEQSIAAQIQQYTSSAHAASDADLEVYARALEFVRVSLQTTLDGTPGPGARGI
jgi:hypothetical protein|tara:strand:+ start:138 stop:764 length:627 start_codon:yes stop_codon:yes gene_type:complete